MTIKQSPEDFVVEERLTPAFTASVTQAPGACAVYRLTKTSLTSPEALRRLTAALGAAQGAAALAGLKDKHARTIQHVTVRLPPEAESRQAAGRAAGPGWEAVRMGWCDRPIDAGAIAGNHFRIVVRGLTGARCAAMDAAAGALAAGAGRLRLVNYFGDQRFGSARHHKGFVAPHLIRGEFEAALRLAIATVARQDNRAQKAFKRAAAAGWGRWEELARTLRRCPDRRAIEALAATGGDFRAGFAALPYMFQQLCVFAYQSHLWNAMARELIGARCTGKSIVASDPFGAMLFPAVAGVPAELAGLILPVPGRSTQPAEPWTAAAGAVLAAEKLPSFHDLRIPGLRRPFFAQAERRLFFDAEDFKMSPSAQARPGAQLDRVLEFTLPRGGYATVVLRALGH